MTEFHAKYFAHELTRQRYGNDVSRLSQSLFDACVDLNPHQIEAALFALRTPISKGVILADEVGLGKTIEAGVLLCQFWAERKRRLLVICPASLRKQWSLELFEKFNLPTAIIDKKAYGLAKRNGQEDPFRTTDKVIITSMNFASKMKDEIGKIAWDMVIIDEAHKLRNVYKTANVMGQNLRGALSDRRKILLTATPLQNSLMELYGLSTFIDEHLLGDQNSFKSQYILTDSKLNQLRGRIDKFCHRTLRSDVLEYIKYTARKPITFPFSPSDDEQKLYDSVSTFLLRENTYAIPKQQRQLTTLILRKLLASSSHAIAGTLETMRQRLEDIKAGKVKIEDFLSRLISDEDIEDEIIEEAEEAEATDEQSAPSIDYELLEAEIQDLIHFAELARAIKTDAKTIVLLKALETGFAEMYKLGANRKSLIFTESRRTQEYLKSFLDANGYKGQIVVFNGTNTDQESKAIYDEWLKKNKPLGRATGSRAVDMRTAIIEHFRDNASIMIATEAAAEGINLQFCSMVINYDLPWNPQRIEQRIGRCHRYGQQHDVVVVNFLNERNAADQRIYDLLQEKFKLFEGVFGASDEVLGIIESGIDFEKRILGIYQTCRTPAAIDEAFTTLRKEMDEKIQSRMQRAKLDVMTHLDEDVRSRLRFHLNDTESQLDRTGKMFWRLSRYILKDEAKFDNDNCVFDLLHPMTADVKPGRYHLITKGKENISGDYLYRLSHPLGEYVIAQAKKADTPEMQVTFDLSGYMGKISVLEQLKGHTGRLTLTKVVIDTLDREEHLVFSAIDDQQRPVDHETCTKLFQLEGKWTGVPPAFLKVEKDVLSTETRCAIEKCINDSTERNRKHFEEEREKLENWADDKLYAAEKELVDLKGRIKQLTREARQAADMEKQHALQTQIQDMERKKRRLRENIFNVEDEISAERDRLISELAARLKQKIETETLFTIEWAIE